MQEDMYTSLLCKWFLTLEYTDTADTKSKNMSSWYADCEIVVLYVYVYTYCIALNRFLDVPSIELWFNNPSYDQIWDSCTQVLVMTKANV